MKPFVVYLLCIDVPDAAPDHYVGITTPRRLRVRMREHAAGKGSLRTNRVRQEEATFHLAATYPTEDKRLEQRLHRHPELHRLCPRCSHGLTISTHKGKFPLPDQGPVPALFAFAAKPS